MVPAKYLGVYSSARVLSGRNIGAMIENNPIQKIQPSQLFNVMAPGSWDSVLFRIKKNRKQRAMLMAVIRNNRLWKFMYVMYKGYKLSLALFHKITSLQHKNTLYRVFNQKVPILSLK